MRCTNVNTVSKFLLFPAILPIGSKTHKSSYAGLDATRDSSSDGRYLVWPGAAVLRHQLRSLGHGYTDVRDLSGLSIQLIL